MTPSPAARVPNETVVGTYDRLATIYDLVLGPLAAGTRRRALELLRVEAGARVVEVGCGPGHALVGLAERVGPTGRVVGIDAAPRMVSRARRRAARAGLADRVAVLLGDARSLPVRDRAADVAFVEDTLELFSGEELAAVVAELRRVLAPDGRLGVVTMERAEAEADPFVRAYDWAFDHVPGYARLGCRPVYARRALEAGGFVVEREERRRRGYVWPVEILIARPD